MNKLALIVFIALVASCTKQKPTPVYHSIQAGYRGNDTVPANFYKH